MAPVRRERAVRPDPRATAIAGVDGGFADEPFDHRFMALALLGLPLDVVPIETEPFEVALHRLDESGLRAFAIEVLET